MISIPYIVDTNKDYKHRSLSKSTMYQQVYVLTRTPICRMTIYLLVTTIYSIMTDLYHDINPIYR